MAVMTGTNAGAKAKKGALQAPYTFSFMRRGKGSSGGGQSTAGGGAVAAAAAAVSKEDEADQKKSGESKEEEKTNTSTTAPHPYENAIKTIATVHTVQEFWQVYDWLKRPSDLPTGATTDYHLFRAGIKPTWEDPSNAKGGKWIVRLPKGLASRYWEEIVLALLGHAQQFWSMLPENEICGAVLSIRYSEDILAVWNRTANDRDVVERIRDAVKKCLQLPQSHANMMEYKPHQTSLQDRSSFRNTQVWKSSKQQSEGGVTGGRSSLIVSGLKESGVGGGVNLIPAHNPDGGATSASSVGSADSGGDGRGITSRRSNSWGEERKAPSKRNNDGPGRWRS